MLSAHNQFLQNMQRTQDLLALCINLNTTTGGVLDLGDLPRACIVLGISALDHFVHEITRVGRLQIYGNARPATDSFRRFAVSMNGVLSGIATPGDLTWLEAEIRSQHGWVSFQNADKIADAARLVSSKRLWEEVAAILGTDARSAKNQLNLIVDRRNKIAHEADMDPSAPGARWPIDFPLVQEALQTLTRIAQAIHDVLCTP